jgi:hypothetical protein
MMTAAVDSENQIVPMAFALAEGENNDSWSWFMRLLHVHVLGPSRTIYLILDCHIGILNATGEHIDGHLPTIGACGILPQISGGVNGRRRRLTS